MGSGTSESGRRPRISESATGPIDNHCCSARNEQLRSKTRSYLDRLLVREAISHNERPACLSHHPTAAARKKAVIRVSCLVFRDPKTWAGGTAVAQGRLALRLLAVLDVLSSTPARAKRLAPRPDGPLTHFASPRDEKCRLVPPPPKCGSITAKTHVVPFVLPLPYRRTGLVSTYPRRGSRVFTSVVFFMTRKAFSCTGPRVLHSVFISFFNHGIQIFSSFLHGFPFNGTPYRGYRPSPGAPAKRPARCGR